MKIMRIINKEKYNKNKNNLQYWTLKEVIEYINYINNVEEDKAFEIVMDKSREIVRNLNRQELLEKVAYWHEEVNRCIIDYIGYDLEKNFEELLRSGLEYAYDKIIENEVESLIKIIEIEEA